MTGLDWTMLGLGAVLAYAVPLAVWALCQWVRLVWTGLYFGIGPVRITWLFLTRRI